MRDQTFSLNFQGSWQSTQFCYCWVNVDETDRLRTFTFSIQVGEPIASDSSLAQMARLQGEGVKKWWEGGAYEIAYVKDTKEGAWKIKRLEYQTLSRADYKPGRSHAKPIATNRFSQVYPRDPSGPDRLIKQA